MIASITIVTHMCYVFIIIIITCDLDMNWVEPFEMNTKVELHVVSNLINVNKSHFSFDV